MSQVFDLRTIALNTRDFFRVLKSTGDAYRILSRTKPDVLFVKGGFVGVPVGLAARLKRIPIITHDSDTVGGLANKIVSRWAVVHATGMPADLYDYKKSTVEYVGIPLDKHIKLVSRADQATFKHQIGVPKEAKVVLVAGGGNGSQRLNDLMQEVAQDLLNHDPELHIIHLTGQKHLKLVNKNYHDNLMPGQITRVHTFGFVSDFYKYSGAADLIVSRAGASAIAEFATQAKPCVIIPSPFLAAGHQLKNARLLEDKAAALILPEHVSGEIFSAKVRELLADRRAANQLASNLHKLSKPGASEKLAEIILKIAKERA